MALHPDFPDSPHVILDPAMRWFPADEALRDTGMDKLMPPLVAQLRKKVKEFRDGGYVGASDTSKSLLNWWFREPHLLPQADGTMAEFQYFFAQREALETIIYLYDVVGVKDKFDLMRFDSSGAVSAGMFDETWRRFVIKMATGSGKTKVMSLALAWSYFHRLYESDSKLSRNFLVIAPTSSCWIASITTFRDCAFSSTIRCCLITASMVETGGMIFSLPYTNRMKCTSPSPLATSS